jgi:NADH dehydrogenase [ubiquinone] 1 alpha subcomplex assembly factor 5
VAYHTKVIDEQTLAGLESESYDVVLSSLALHWVNDLPACLNEIKRVLKPNGAFIAAMFGQDTLHELRTAFVAAEVERHGGVSAHVSPMMEVADGAALLGNVGFAIPTGTCCDLFAESVDTVSPAVPNCS